MKNNVVIFEKESSSCDVILGYLSDNDNIVIDKVFNDYKEGFKYTKQFIPKFVLFSMTEDAVLCRKIISKLSEMGINVIVLSEIYTTAAIINALRNGAVDFVPKPVIKKDLEDAILKCIQSEKKVLKKSQIISVYSTKGGVGKTSIATNVAIELSKITRDNVALVDLDIPMGDVNTFLDIAPTPNIFEIVANSTSNVMDICKRYKNSSLYVLSEPPAIKQTNKISVKNLVKIFNNLRDAFSFIVIDMGCATDSFNMSILENSDFILLTTIVNLPLIRNCQHCLDLMESCKIPSDKIKVIVNRYLENDEITIADMEKAINHPVYWKIPNNYYTVMSSINKGIPVSEMNENSGIAESFSKLASNLLESMFEKDILKIKE